MYFVNSFRVQSLWRPPPPEKNPNKLSYVGLGCHWWTCNNLNSLLCLFLNLSHNDISEIIDRLLFISTGLLFLTHFYFHSHLLYSLLDASSLTTNTHQSNVKQSLQFLKNIILPKLTLDHWNVPHPLPSKKEVPRTLMCKE